MSVQSLFSPDFGLAILLVLFLCPIPETEAVVLLAVGMDAVEINIQDALMEVVIGRDEIAVGRILQNETLIVENLKRLYL